MTTKSPKKCQKNDKKVHKKAEKSLKEVRKKFEKMSETKAEERQTKSCVLIAALPRTLSCHSHVFPCDHRPLTLRLRETSAELINHKHCLNISSQLNMNSLNNTNYNAPLSLQRWRKYQQYKYSVLPFTEVKVIILRCKNSECYFSKSTKVSN